VGCSRGSRSSGALAGAHVIVAPGAPCRSSAGGEGGPSGVRRFMGGRHQRKMSFSGPAPEAPRARLAFAIRAERPPSGHGGLRGARLGTRSPWPRRFLRRAASGRSVVMLAGQRGPLAGGRCAFGSPRASWRCGIVKPGPRFALCYYGAIEGAASGGQGRAWRRRTCCVKTGRSGGRGLGSVASSSARSSTPRTLARARARRGGWPWTCASRVLRRQGRSAGGNRVTVVLGSALFPGICAAGAYSRFSKLSRQGRGKPLGRGHALLDRRRCSEAHFAGVAPLASGPLLPAPREDRGSSSGTALSGTGARSAHDLTPTRHAAGATVRGRRAGDADGRGFAARGEAYWIFQKRPGLWGTRGAEASRFGAGFIATTGRSGVRGEPRADDAG